MKKNSGITLIALVITIVIIIILASITINFAFGDDGLINMAEEARDLHTNSTEYEQDSMANLTEYMKDYMAGLNNESGSGEEGSGEEEGGGTTPGLEFEIDLAISDISYNTCNATITTDLADSQLGKIEYSVNGGSTWTDVGSSKNFQVEGLIANSSNQVQVRVTATTGETELASSNTITTPAAVRVKYVYRDDGKPLSGGVFYMTETTTSERVSLIEGEGVKTNTNGEVVLVFEPINNVQYNIIMQEAAPGYNLNTTPVTISLDGTGGSIDALGVINVTFEAWAGGLLPGM